MCVCSLLHSYMCADKMERRAHLGERAWFICMSVVCVCVCVGGGVGGGYMYTCCVHAYTPTRLS